MSQRPGWAAVWVLSLLLLSALAALPTADAAPPTLAVLSPVEGSVIGYGAPVMVTVRLTDFNLTTPGTPPAPGQGHLVVSVDGETVLLADTVSFSLALEPGPHTILVALAANNGTALGVTATVGVTATRGPSSGSPGIVITYPPEGFHRGIDTAISFRLSNFSLVPPGGQAAVREGHIHVLLDGVPYEERWESTPIEFSDMPAREHEVTLRLVDSQHAPLVPDVSATVHFTAEDRGKEDITFPLQITAGVLAFMLVLVLILPVRRREP